MISVTDVAEEFKAIPAAKTDNSTDLESAIPNQSKDKAHCFCPKLAALHGEETAVVLQGLGYKIGKSKKLRDGRKWHYDTLKSLETRWPYLSDSGIHAMLERREKAGDVIKGNYNTWTRDTTTWYSMKEGLVKRALEEEGKLWFDVSAAVACHSVIAGTLYQNLRYQLLLRLADYPGSAPYVKINKAGLARVLPWSLSTIKREFKELEAKSLILENPLRAGEYTLCNPLDIVVPQAMIGSSMERNGSFMETVVGSSVELTGSSMEIIGSSVELIGSSMENITHYKPFEKAIHKHHSLTAAPVVVGACVDAAHAAKGLDHQDISNQHHSFTVPVEEEAASGSSPLTQTHSSVHERPDTMMDIGSFRIPSTFQELVSLNKQLIPAVASFDEEMGHDLYECVLLDQCEYLVSKLSPNDIDKWLAATKTSEVMAGLIERFRGTLEEQMRDLSEWAKMPKNEFWPLIFYPGLEIISLAFRGDLIDASKHGTSIPKHHLLLEKLNEKILEQRLADADSSVVRKIQIFKETVEVHNRDGWCFKDGTEVKNAVCVTKPYLKQIARIFELNPHLTPAALVDVVWECIWWSRQEKPSTGDRHYWSRRGADLGTFCRKLDLIVGELDMREKCAVVEL